MPDTLTITDNRTGKQYEVPIKEGAIRATDLRQLKTSQDDWGLMTYDPAFMNTANCRSRITFIDGDKGILEYRGYPIEQLAEGSTFLETAYLLIHGELPNAAQLKEWTSTIASNVAVPDQARQLVKAFSPSAHPMGVFLSLVGALSTVYPESKKIDDEATRRAREKIVAFYQGRGMTEQADAWRARASVDKP